MPLQLSPSLRVVQPPIQEPSSAAELDLTVNLSGQRIFCVFYHLAPSNKPPAPHAFLWPHDGVAWPPPFPLLSLSSLLVAQTSLLCLRQMFQEAFAEPDPPFLQGLQEEEGKRGAWGCLGMLHPWMQWNGSAMELTCSCRRSWFLPWVLPSGLSVWPHNPAAVVLSLPLQVSGMGAREA